MFHVFPTFGYGGQQTRFAALAAGLGAEFSHRVLVIGGDLSAAALAPANADIEIEDFAAEKTPLVSTGNIFALRRRIARANADILCTYNWGSIEAVLANAIGPRLAHIHFEDGFGPDESLEVQAFRRVMARRLFLRRASVVAPSTALEKLAIERWKLPARRVLRISNGVDLARFQKPPPEFSNDIRIGSVGALRPEKNFQRLIAAFAHAGRNAPARLTIVGEGPEREALAAHAEQSAAAGRVFLPGATSAPENSYAECDIFALSSDTEQAPMALAEAMAAGLPVVATDVGDVADMVAQENRAFITPLGDEEAYALALGRLMRDASARMRMGEANRRKAEKEFGLDKMVARHRALYLEKVRRA